MFLFALPSPPLFSWFSVIAETMPQKPAVSGLFARLFSGTLGDGSRKGRNWAIVSDGGGGSVPVI